MSNLITSWSESDIIWLKQNYENNGPSYCSRVLNKPHKAVYYKSKTLTLRYVYPENINSNQFLNIQTKEIAYLLGILYADGTIRHTKKRICYPIILSSKSDDANTIYNTIMSTGKWNFYTYKKNNHSISLFTTYNKKIWDFLYENDYYEKSERSATKILSKIPNNLRSYFFRGFLDGDGYIRVKKKIENSVVFTGNSKQNWEFIIDLLKSINISYVPGVLVSTIYALTSIIS